jgi:phenylacetate-CoA ligase
MNPALLQKRTPLLTPTAQTLLHEMLTHPDAPRWNYECGDQINQQDLERLHAFKAELIKRRKPWSKKTPPLWMIQKISSWLIQVPAFRAYSLQDLSAQWEEIPTTSRIDLASRVSDFVPANEDIERMMVYTTSGTTGHPILVPSHPFSASCYLVFLDFVLDAFEVSRSLREDNVGCLLLCAQQKTITYATLHTYWNLSGFAKINLMPHDWPSEESVARYCQRFSPQVVSGDPISFAEMLRQRLPIHPRAMISTALSLSQGLQRQLEERYQCPVIDWYSSNETGPLAYKCREGFFHILPHDIFVEVLNPDGTQSQGRGEITITGGRNPFLPLLRYRTGDFASIEKQPCQCGDEMPRIIEIEGRAPVVLYAASGEEVNTVDVSRVLQKFPIIQHQLVQKRDSSLCLTLHVARQDIEDEVKLQLSSLFGALPIQIIFVERFSTQSGKVLPYRSEAGAK